MASETAAASAPPDTGPGTYLFRLADYLERPDAAGLAAVVAALAGIDAYFSDLRGIPSEAGRRIARRSWDESLRADGPSGVAREFVEAWTADLLAGDEATWARLLHGFLRDPQALSRGVGARLKALSPFAGKVLVTVVPRHGRCELDGDVSALFGRVVLAAGHPQEVGGRYLVALDPDCLSGAQIAEIRPARAPGEA